MGLDFFPQSAAEEGFPAQEKHPQRIAVTPEMDIKPIERIVHGDVFPVPDHPLHDTQDVRVCDITLYIKVVVPGDQVARRQHPQDPVQNKLSVPLIQHHVVLLAPPWFLFPDLNDISPLPQQGHHADTNIGVDKYAVPIQDLIKGTNFRIHHL